MDKYGEMEVFVRVVNEGGFSAAARALNVTPSAVSKFISRLEDRLDARLLNRTTRRLSPTEEGRAFHERCVRILAEIEEAEQAVSRLNAVPSGTLRVNAAVAIATYQLVPLLPEFMARYPLVHVDLAVTDRVVDLVEEGADIGIRTGARFDSQLVSRLLAEDHRVIVAAPSYLERRGVPKTPMDLLRHNCLMRSGAQAFLNEWSFDGPDGPFTLPIKGNTKVNNGETLYEMVMAGLGICRLGEFRVAADIRDGQLVSLLTDTNRTEPLPIHVVYSHRKHLSPRVRAFVDYLIEKFTPVPPWVVVEQS
ncbi:MAG: LysR family transcriptional regulator [Rhodospirillales bacterium]|nr:LysR family transcriptional regulator [Rhodospirillales bacterium]